MATPLSAAEVQKQMAANSAAWKTATPQMQTQLHQANLDLAKQTGQSYNAAQGTYSAPVTAKPLSAATATPVAKPVIPILPEVAARDTATAQSRAVDWINNPKSGTGGLDTYAAKQNERYAGALSANDTDLMGRLTADSQRVGYKLNTPTPQPIPTAAPVSAAQTTGNQSGYPGGLTTAQISADADARMAKQRAGIEGAVTAGKAARKSLFDYNAKNTNDSRVLENSQNARTLSPFSGKTGYLQSQIERGRGIDDTFTNQNYTNDVNALDAQLTSFDAMAPEQQQALYDQLTRQERDYGLQVGSLTGQFNGRDTLAKQGQDAQYTGVYNGQQTLQAQQQQFNQKLETAKYGLDVKQQHIDLANKLTELFGVKVNPTTDPMQSYAQVAGLSTTAAQKIAADAKQSTFDNAIKLALANNTISQSQANTMYRAQEIGISQQNANTSSANSGNSASNNQQNHLMEIWKATGKAPAGLNGVTEGTAYTGASAAAAGKAQTAETYSKYLDSVAQYTKDPDTGKNVLSNPDAVESAILTSGLSEYEMFKAYKAKGLPWSGPIPTPGK